MHREIELIMRPLDFVVQLPFSWRQRRARALRDEMTRERFVAELASGDAEELAARLLWDKLVDIAVVPDFRPSPDDNFLYIYGLADEDLDDDLILRILTTLKRNPPPPPLVRRIGPISSPRDFMKLMRHTSIVR
jgi:hypothetical protein